MSSKPCKFFIGDSKEPLDYNQMREYLFKNPDFVKISEPPVVEQTTVDVGGEKAPDVSNPALKDVESTAKALDDISMTDKWAVFLKKNLPILPFSSREQISEAYHKAKQDGSNPELVQAVEQLLTPTTNETEITQTTGEEASKSANEALSTERNIRAEGQEAVEPVAAAAVSDEVVESPKPNEGGAKDVKPEDNERNIAAIKSKRLTHVPGTRMGANQVEGMYISTEDSNRYTDLYLPTAGTLQDVTVNIKNPFVSYDIGFADMHNEVLNENKDKFEDIDFIEFAPPTDMDVWNTDILSEFGNAKVVKLTTDKLKSLGYDSVYFPQTYYQEGELIVFDRGNVGLKPKTDAIQEQATSEVPVQPKAGTGKEVAQGTSESKAEKPAQKSEKKLSKEAKESLDKRDFAIRLKEYNDLPKTQKRTEEGNSMLQGLKNDAKKLKYATEVVATKSKGFVLNVKDKSGKVISVATAKRVGNPDAAIWSNEDTFVNFGRNQDGTKVIRIYDANSLVELDNRSKKYQDAKLNFIRSYAPNFIGTKEPIDYDALGERYGFDIDGYNVAVAQQLARTNNAFEIAANFNILDILDNLESLNQEYNVERALADWLGSISESDVKRWFDPNWLKGSRSSWVSKSNTIPLDKRVKALVNIEDGRGVEVPELSQYANDEGGVIEAISELIQKYPNGANSVPKTTNPYTQDIKNNFRELTGLELNEETAAMFKALYYNTDFAGVQSDLSWEQLSEEAKTQITNEQEQAFPADENLDGATTEIRATTSEGEGGTEQTAEAAGIEIGGAKRKIAEKAKSVADNIRSGKLNKPGYLQASAGAVVWDTAIETIATAVEQGGNLAQAVSDGFTYIRNSDYYKALADKDKRKFIKDFTKSINQLRRDYSLDIEPILTIGDIDNSALVSRLVEGKKLPAEVREGLKENGLKYKVENQELAKDYADALIDELGLEDAVSFALSGDLKGATKTFILGKNVDLNSKNPNSADFFKAVEVFDEALRAAGEEIAAAYRVYLNSPEGLYHYERRKVRKDIDKELEKGTKGKNIAATKGHNKRQRKEKAAEAAKEVVDDLSGKTEPSVTEKKVNPDSAKRKAALDKLAKAKEKLRKSMGLATSGGINPEMLEALVEIGVANIELGYLNAKAWLRKMREDLKGIADDLTDKQLTDILETAKTGDGKTLSEVMLEERWNAAKEELASKIASAVKETKPTFDPISVVVNTLFTKATQKLEKKKVERMSDLEKAKYAIENYANAQKIWEEAKVEVNKLIDDMKVDEETKEEYKAQLFYFYSVKIGWPFSENSAKSIIKDEVNNLLSGASLREKIERLLANSTQGQAKSKAELIESISDKLELEVFLSPSQAKYIAKQFADRYEQLIAAETKKFLDQQFKPRQQEDLTKREEQHQAITREIIWGALNDAEFLSKFYDKYKLGFVNDPAFNAELKRLAEKVYNAPEGFLRQQAFDNLASFVIISRGGINYWSLPINAMVNNLLMGVDSYIKAVDSNTVQTIATAGQMIAADPKNAKFYLQKLFSNKGEGVINLQLRKIGFWMGIKGIQPYKESKFAGLELGKQLETFGKTSVARGYGKYLQTSNKMLSAVDLFYSKPGEYAKFAQLILKNIEIENNKLSKSERLTKEQLQGLVNEILGETSQHVSDAKAKAEAEIKKAYGVDEIVFNKKNPSKEEVAFKARVVEILEQGRQKRLDEVKSKIDWLAPFTNEELDFFAKYSKGFGEKISSMGLPRGSGGAVSIFLQGLGKSVPLLKFMQYAPVFVNAPINFGNLIIDSTPLGAVRAVTFAGRGRRGVIIGEEAARSQGEYTREDNELVFKMERNALWKRVLALNACTYLGLAAMGFNFFGDDDEEEFTVDKFKDMPYYVTGSIHSSPDRREMIKKTFGIEEYCVYSYGKLVMTYRNSSLMATLAPQGHIMDAQSFRSKEIDSNLDLFVAGFMATIAFISEQSSMKGFSELLSACFGFGKYGSENISKNIQEASKRNISSSLKYTLLPRFITAEYKDYQGIMTMDKKKAATVKDFLVEDVPFLEDMIVTKQYDHFGEPLKEEYFMPSPVGGLSLIGWENGFFKGPLSDVRATNPYYQMTYEAGYTPKAYRDDKLTKEVTAQEFVNFKGAKSKDISYEEKVSDKEGFHLIEVDLTPEQVAEINRLRGQYVKKYLDDNKNKFLTYSKRERNLILDRLFEVGAKYAKTKVTGVDFVGTPNYADVSQKRFRIEQLDIELPALE